MHVVTPLLPSRALEAAVGSPVWLKMESAQPSGSFKLRGMGHACRAAVARGARHLVTSSGGNAGYAVAYAAARLRVPCTVFVPRRTDERMRGLIAGEGAEVRVAGEVWDDAHAHAVAAAPDLGGATIHPFDHPDVWAGHATLVEEVAEAGVVPGVVVVAVGGGGLLSGVFEGMHRVGWADVPVVAVETEGAASFARALEAGAPVTLDDIRSVALTLGAKRVCQRVVDWVRVDGHPTESVLVSDAAAVRACGRFLDDHRTLVEPACGAALAPVYDAAPEVVGCGPVLVVVCGGASITRAGLSTLEAQTA